MMTPKVRLSAQKIAPKAYEALKQAIAYTTHYKKEQRNLIYRHLGPANFYKANLHLHDFEHGYKIQHADVVVNNLQSRESDMRDDIIEFIISLAQLDRFPDIERLEEPLRMDKLKIAKQAVNGLQEFTELHLQMVEKRNQIEQERRAEEAQIENDQTFRDSLGSLKNRLMALHVSTNAQQRGRDFEELIYDMFDLHDLNPRRSYTYKNEQIDGFVEIEGFGFIVEAKWEKVRSGMGIADIFKSKIDRRSRVTMGLLITQEGAASTILDQYSTSSPFMVVTGQEIFYVLDARTNLIAMLKAKLVHLQKTGSCYLEYISAP